MPSDPHPITVASRRAEVERQRARHPDATVLESRFYLPADYGPPLEVMPSPAPTGVYHVSTWAFAGEDPNGTWAQIAAFLPPLSLHFNLFLEAIDAVTHATSVSF